MVVAAGRESKQARKHASKHVSEGRMGPPPRIASGMAFGFRFPFLSFPFLFRPAQGPEPITDTTRPLILCGCSPLSAPLA